MKIKNTEIKIIQGDITALEVDAIVNPANDELLMDVGFASVLKNRGGEVIQDEAREKSPVDVGESVETSAGELKAKNIIHSVASEQDGKPDEKSIRAACASALELAGELKLKSIVFPALGCGVGGFPAIGSAKILSQEILKCCKFKDTSLEKITVCLFDSDTFGIFEETIMGYITHIQDTLCDGPYVTVDIIIEHSVENTNADEGALPVVSDISSNKGIVIIERSNPPYGFALPGGFVDCGESLEDAATREAKEETNLELEDLKQFHTYSDPKRDPRFHTVSTVFTAKGKGTAITGDDAKRLHLIAHEELMSFNYAFDHKEIIKSYLESQK